MNLVKSLKFNRRWLLSAGLVGVVMVLAPIRLLPADGSFVADDVTNPPLYDNYEVSRIDPERLANPAVLCGVEWRILHYEHQYKDEQERIQRLRQCMSRYGADLSLLIQEAYGSAKRHAERCAYFDTDLTGSGAESVIIDRIKYICDGAIELIELICAQETEAVCQLPVQEGALRESFPVSSPVFRKYHNFNEVKSAFETLCTQLHPTLPVDKIWGHLVKKLSPPQESNYERLPVEYSKEDLLWRCQLPREMEQDWSVESYFTGGAEGVDFNTPLELARYLAYHERKRRLLCEKLGIYDAGVKFIALHVANEVHYEGQFWLMRKAEWENMLRQYLAVELAIFDCELLLPVPVNQQEIWEECVELVGQINWAIAAGSSNKSLPDAAAFASTQQAWLAFLQAFMAEQEEGDLVTRNTLRTWLVEKRVFQLRRLLWLFRQAASIRLAHRAAAPRKNDGVTWEGQVSPCPRTT